MILGKVEFEYGAQPALATLDGRLKWASSVDGMGEYLQAAFGEVSPADGQPGMRLLHDAAEYLKGKATWLAPEPEESAEGIIY